MFCRYGRHRKEDSYRGRCRKCRAENMRRYRADGRAQDWGRKDRHSKRYWADPEKSREANRARYAKHAKRYRALRKIRRLQSLMQPTEGELFLLRELLALIARLKTTASKVPDSRPPAAYLSGLKNSLRPTGLGL